MVLKPGCNLGTQACLTPGVSPSGNCPSATVLRILPRQPGLVWLHNASFSEGLPCEPRRGSHLQDDERKARTVVRGQEGKRRKTSSLCCNRLPSRPTRVALVLSSSRLPARRALPLVQFPKHCSSTLAQEWCHGQTLESQGGRIHAQLCEDSFMLTLTRLAVLSNWRAPYSLAPQVSWHP